MDSSRLTLTFPDQIEFTGTYKSPPLKTSSPVVGPATLLLEQPSELLEEIPMVSLANKKYPSQPVMGGHRGENARPEFGETLHRFSESSADCFCGVAVG